MNSFIARLKRQALTLGAFVVAFVAALLTPLAANAQVVSTLAGSGTVGSANGPGTTASFSDPRGVAVDASGNVYVADYYNNLIRKIAPAGDVSTFAGSGAYGSADGPGPAASFRGPLGVAVDASGNVYVADLGNNKIRKITPGSVVSTFAGSGVLGSADGPGATASFNSPAGVAVDASGNVYVADASNNMIRKITPAGDVSTLAGFGAQGSANGPGTTASFYWPNGVAVDASGNVYVADYDNNLIRKITPAGDVSTLAGSGTAGSANGPGTTASFYWPFGVAVDASGNVYVADTYNNMIRKITPAGVVSTFAGSGTAGSANGPGTTASFYEPFGVAVDASGNVYVGDSFNNKIRKITPTAGCSLPAPTATSNSPVCVGSALQLQASYVSGGYFWSWTGPNGWSSNLQNPVISAATLVAAGTYSVTVSTGECTSPAASTDVTVVSAPAAPVISVPATAQPGQQGLVASVADHSGSTYLWTSGYGTITSGQGTATIVFGAPALFPIGAAHAVTLQVTETSASGCRSAAGTATISIIGPCYGLTTGVSPAGVGSVTVNTVQNCTGGGYNPSTAIGLTANPPAGYTFSGWSGSGGSFSSTTANPTAFTITGTASVTATFTPICYGLTTGVSPAGVGSVTVNTVQNCAGGGYNPSTAISLTANPPAGYTFSGWSGSGGSFSSTTANPTTFTITGTASVTATFAPPACNAPLAPVNLSITAKGSPVGTLPGGTDFLSLAWQAAPTGQAPIQYQYRVNGDPLTTLAATTADAPPRKDNSPITLYVNALACSQSLPSPVVSTTVHPAPPIVSFTIDRNSVPVKTNVTLTDNSSPQATSWLWLFSGGIGPITTQFATVQFAVAGTYQVALIASNGAGSSVSGLQTITVTSAASLTTDPSFNLSRFDPAGEGRLVLARAELGGEGPTYLSVRNLSVDEEAVAFLRAVDEDGRLVVERRLVIPANDEATYDAGAWGLEGPLRLELVSTTPVTAYLQTEQRAKPQGPRFPQEP